MNGKIKKGYCSNSKLTLDAEFSDDSNYKPKSVKISVRKKDSKASLKILGKPSSSFNMDSYSKISDTMFSFSGFNGQRTSGAQISVDENCNGSDQNISPFEFIISSTK